MKVLLDLTIVPLGVGLSLSKYVAACEDVLEGRDLTTRLHANGTNIEGDWDEVFEAVKACHERLFAMGVPRIHTNIKLGTRSDREQSLDDKVASIRSKRSAE